MEENKAVLHDEENEKEYLVTNAKKNRFSTKFCDICITCFGIIACALLCYIQIALGMSQGDNDRTIKGYVYGGVAILLVIWLIIVIRSKNSKFVGGIYPFAVMVFSVTTATVTSIQRLMAGQSLVRTGNLWNLPLVFICMSVLSIIVFILYLQKSKDYSPRFMMAALALMIMPTLAMMKNQSNQLLGYFGEYMSSSSMLLTTEGIIGIGGTLALLFTIVTMIFGFALRLIDRGDNYLKVEPRVVEVPVEVPVIVYREKPKRKPGLLVVKTVKKKDHKK